MGRVKEKLAEGTTLAVELNASEVSAHYGNHGLHSAAVILKLILSEISSSDQDLASLALRSLACYLRNENFIVEISDENASAVVTSVCQLIMSTNNKVVCSLALKCLDIQELRQQVVEALLDLILKALLYVTDSCTFASSKALIHQALRVFVKLAHKYSCARVKSSLWAPAIYKRLLSIDKKEREGAEQCMKDLEFMLIPSQQSLSEVVAVDISESLLPKLEKMVKSKNSVLPAVRAWGWFIRLLGSLAGEKRTLVNQMLKIVEVTFTSQDALVRNASLVVWEALIDALLQLPNALEQQNANMNVEVSLSTGELEKPLSTPPLKRLKLLMVPLISIMSADKDQVVRLACWRTWQCLAQKLGTAINQPSAADVVVIPIFEAMFKFGPDKNHSSAWDLCLKALEDWILCKFQYKLGSCLPRALSISMPGKPPSPRTPTCGVVKDVADTTFIIQWIPWSLDTLHIFLKLVKILWNFGLKCLKSSCTRNLSLNGALRIFLLLVNGVEGDGKCAVKPLKQHIDSVHSLLMFLDDVSFLHEQTSSMEEVLLAVSSLIESLLDLQPLVLSSSFYKLALAPTNLQRKLGEQCDTFSKSETAIKEQEITEARSGGMVTPIVYLLHSWVSVASMTELSKPESETFMKRLERLVVLATQGFNVLSNLSGLASVLEFHLSRMGGIKRVYEADKTPMTSDVDASSGNFCVAPHVCAQLLMAWKIIAEHATKYLEGSNDMFAAEDVAGDSGYQVIFRILLFPLQVFLQPSSLTSADLNKTSFEVTPSGFASGASDIDLQLLFSAWRKLFDCALSVASRTSLQANLFTSGLSQQILKFLEKEWQEQGYKGAGNESNLFAELVVFIAINVLKRTESSSFAMLAINRKRRYGSFIGTASTTSVVRGSETETTSNVRNILVLASRVLDSSCDKCTAGEAYWLGPIARVLEELATFSLHLNSQQDMLMFVQEFSKPYAKWLKFSESFHVHQDNHNPTTLTHSLRRAWQEHLHSLRKCYPPLPFNSNLLSLQALALASAFQHSDVSILNSTISFWEATYGSKATALKYPPCLVPVLEKLKSKSNVSLPGWNRGCADSSRRKSDVTYYTLTGRRCLQVFQEHLTDAQKAPSGMSLPSPRMAQGGENTSFQGGPSSPRSTCELSSKATGVIVDVVREKSVTLPGLSMYDHTSMEANQAGIGYSTEEEAKKPAAHPTGNSLVATIYHKADVPGVVRMDLLSTPPMSAAPPKRKNLRFVDLKTFAYASNPISEEGLVCMTEGQLEVDMVKGGPERHGVIPPTMVTAFNSLYVEDLNCFKGAGPSGTDERILKRPRKSFVRELKKLGIRQQRFLRSSGSLRGGKFWRDTSETVKAMQKIRKGVALSGAENTTTFKDSGENKTVSAHEARRISDEPSPLVKQEGFEASAGESKDHVINETHGGHFTRKRGRPRRSLGLAKSDPSVQSLKESAPVINVEDAGQLMQGSVEKVVDLGMTKGERFQKKGSPESPFRVQTLNRNLYGKIFSSVVRQSNTIKSFASRSHHRKSSCPRRLPMSEDDVSQESRALHSTLKLKKKARIGEYQLGVEFTTPSKILRSGKRLKSKKWGTFSAAKKVGDQGIGNPLQKAISLEYSRSLRHSRATDWYHANVGKTMIAEPDLLPLRSSKICSELLVGEQPHQNNFESILGHDGRSNPHENAFDANGSTSLLNMLQKCGELVEKGSRHRFCDLLADLSTSLQWNIMSLEDLDYAQKLLGKLQGIVGESKRCLLVGQVVNIQQTPTHG